MTTVPPARARRPRRARALALAAGVALTGCGLAACSAEDTGSSDGRDGAATEGDAASTTTYAGIPPQRWAAIVCDGIADWKRVSAQVNRPLPAAGAALARELTRRLDAAATATTTLARDLDDAGVPATRAGDSAQRQLHPLSTQLGIAASTLTSLASGVVTDPSEAKNRIAQAATTLKEADGTARAAMLTIGRLDPAGDLGRALNGQASCKPFLSPAR